MSSRGQARQAKIRNAALLAVLLIAAVGLLYRMLRPYFESPPPAPRSSAPVSAEPRRADVLRVIDGDTIEVRWRGRPERVRLLRIDTPERGQRGHAEATAALERLVGGREVTLAFEEAGRPQRDKYDRLLAYVVVDGRNANVELVRSGWSRFWTRYGAGRLADRFAAAEQQAATARAGLWGPDGWSGD
jgi:micrococcal nuclease